MVTGPGPLAFLIGTPICRYTVEPSRRAVTFAAGSGSRFSGARGGPFLPQPRTAIGSHRRTQNNTERFKSFSPSRGPRSGYRGLKDVPREVLVARDVAQHAVDIRAVDRDVLLPHFRRVERNLIQQLLHHRVQAARADVLGALVHERGEVRDASDRVV